MEVAVRKWGNSLGLRLPSVIAKNMALRDGSSVELQDTDEGLLIKPKTHLAEMLKKITKQNMHSEIPTGAIVGKELW
jgi:antitoxin MazE